MKLKSLITKIIPGKKDSPEPNTDQHEEMVHHEMPLNKLDTRIENSGTVGEIDIYVNNEKTSIHTLASETKIGRDPSQSDIIISELIVSKLHCTIYSVGNDFYIKDNSSTNGVFINDQRISDDQLINNGEMILLGKKGAVKIFFHKR
jgi:pSer/pThr/pTyr-binding forkhead associated (FHA) protein